MKIKTRELDGMALCYTLCMIEMPHLVWGETIGEHHASRQIVVPELIEPKCYSPFMNWEMFGPIIEREGINIQVDVTKTGQWHAKLARPTSIDPRRYCGHFGPTPLIAAMRCYCCSKLGEFVEVPDNLV